MKDLPPNYIPELTCHRLGHILQFATFGPVNSKIKISNRGMCSDEYILFLLRG